ncbi:unnamed protein product [Rodentolepis nana]|uniref:ANK_REP_REGION domain-containing protein n=1 Tax=Rodentolepis nana TaxID=102285 RepID=A0A0R3TNK5_RODNA|nr:unnamed protein product [Rodentolepis nana]
MLASIKTVETGTREEILEHLSKKEFFEHDSDNNTLLHYACLAGNLSAVKVLIEVGFYVNANNVDGHTPLCDAAANGSEEIIKALLRGGANVNPPSYWGSPLMYAIKNGHYGAMTILVDAGADVNACDRQGYCPIHVTVRNRFYKAVEYLLMAGADPNKCCKLTTALHIAAGLRDLKLVQLLLIHGANASLVNSHGRRPIDLVEKDTSLYHLLNTFTVAI